MADDGDVTPPTEQTATDLEAIKRRLERQNDVLRNRKPVDGREADAIDAGDPVEMNPLTSDPGLESDPGADPAGV